MSLSYNCWFSSSPPDLVQLLDQLTDDYVVEEPTALEEKKYLFFFESESIFYLYLNEWDSLYDEEETLLLTIFPNSTTYIGKQTLPVGELEVTHYWHLVMGKSNGVKADEAYARLIRIILQNYVGDFAALFQGNFLNLCRLDGRIYINQSSGLAEDPLFSILEIAPYMVKNYSSK